MAKNKNGNFLCGCCKQTFAKKEGAIQHIKATHDGRLVKLFTVHAVYDMQDKEPSMADRMIKAQMQEAMGEPVDDDWLLDSI